MKNSNRTKPKKTKNKAVRLALYAMKGGSGKTTVAVNLAGLLASAGFRVLYIGADKQEYAETNLLPDYDGSGGNNLFSVLAGECEAKDAVRESIPLPYYRYDIVEGDNGKRLDRHYTGAKITFDILPPGGDINAIALGIGQVDYGPTVQMARDVLAKLREGASREEAISLLEAVVQDADEREHADFDASVLDLYRERTGTLDDDYDVIITDCTPSENDSVMLVLAGSDYVLIPIDGPEALSRSFGFVNTSVLQLNSLGYPVKIAGIVMTKYAKGKAASREVYETLRSEGGDIFISVPIAESTAYSKSFINQTLLSSSPACAAEKNFRDFALEVMKRTGLLDTDNLERN